MERPSLIAVLLAAVVAIFLLLPLFAVVPVSFTPARFLSMPNGNWSIRHYMALIENPAWLQATWLSIRIAVLSSAISTALALAFSLGMWMFRPAFPGVYYGFVLMPMVAPPVVSAITIYFFLTSLSKVNDLVGYDTVVGVAIAHAVMSAPFAVVLITVALSQVDRRIDLAARGFGASVGQRIFRVILPNIKFGVFTAAFMAFVLSWEEIGVTLFITSVNAVTLPRMMWMGLRDNIDPAIAAISVLLIVIVIAVILAKTIVASMAAKKT
jgi:putative spermidine/putrescine transport system permease protein